MTIELTDDGTRSKTAERFTQLQVRWQDADRATRELRNELDRRYQSHRYAPATKRRKLEQLDRAERRQSERFYTLLASISPRDWTHGVPCNWIRQSLTFADAITRDALSTVPPPSWGNTDRDVQAFAAALRS